jgi:phosphoglycolate phosphatase-like HAD superfamily hydrolase
MIECLRPGATAGRAKVVLFDFDGTVSVIRAGWTEIMVPMMVEILANLGTGESESDLRTVVEEFVGRLTGKDTVWQMIELTEQIVKRRGQPQDPLVYKHMYLARLNEKIKDRLEDLRRRRVSPDKYLVPGTRPLLEALRERGLRLYLASGTDEPYMKEEASLLDVERYFDGGVFGAQDDYRNFSKAILIERIIGSAECRGEELLGFGDGYIEIQNVKHVGGVAVGVATDEPDCQVVNEWKRKRLAEVGADYIIPNYLCHKKLLETLLPS